IRDKLVTGVQTCALPISFRATLDLRNGTAPQNAQSIAVRDGHIVSFASPQEPAEATLLLERYTEQDRHVQAAIRFISADPDRPRSEERRVGKECSARSSA